MHYAIEGPTCDRVIHAVAALLIGLGAAFRLAQYFSGRSMWLDESALALNILDRSFRGLTLTLDFDQAAPAGFLLAVKVGVLWLGKSELVLRLFPLICGLVSLPLFYVLARKITSRGAALSGLLLFASADGLIYYSAELKQYACDVTAVIALLAVALPSRELSWRRYFAASLLGAGVLWFSHASIFVSAAIAFTYAVCFVFERRWAELLRVAASSTLWLSSLGLFYVFSLRNAASLQGKLGHTTGLEQGPSTWFHKFSGDIGQLIALPDSQRLLPQLIRFLAAALAIVGTAVLARRRLPVAMMLGSSVAFLELAIALKRYPMFSRTLLFLVPIVLLLLAAGIGASVERLRPRGVAILAGAALTALVAGYPVANAIRHLDHPRVNQEMKPLLRELTRQWRTGDTLYVHYAAQYAFRYYAECKCLGGGTSPDAAPLSLATQRRAGPNLFSPALASRPPNLVVGRVDEEGYPWKAILAAIDRLRGRKRVWILYSHFSSAREAHFLRVVLPHHLDRLGPQEAKFTRSRSGLLLYDLSARK